MNKITIKVKLQKTKDDNLEYVWLIFRETLKISRTGKQSSDFIKNDDIKNSVYYIANVKQEIIRDLVFRIIMNDYVVEAFNFLLDIGALRFIIPELTTGYKVKQSHYHKYDVFNHILYTIKFSPKKIHVRLAALFHDIGKPYVKRFKGNQPSFYNHNKRSVYIAKSVLNRWNVDEDLTNKVLTMVKYHSIYNFYNWDDDKVKELILKIGDDLIFDFLALIEADIKAHGGNIDEQIKEVNKLRNRVIDLIMN